MAPRQFGRGADYRINIVKRPKEATGLEAELGYAFRRHHLLEQALTHSSYAREQQAAGDGVNVRDNEQLEFLGDAILGFVTSEELYSRFPQFHEGQLSKLRAYIVSAEHLVNAARKLKLGDYLRLGRGEEKSGGRSKTALQVDALEALLAAMYLDGGMRRTRAFILERIVEPELKRMGAQLSTGVPIRDYKSALQETAHSLSKPQPHYVLVGEEGPEHKKTFTVEARIHSHGNKVEYVGRGQGSTKKMAEQDAARQVIEYLSSVEQTPKGDRKRRPGTSQN